MRRSTERRRQQSAPRARSAGRKAPSGRRISCLLAPRGTVLPVEKALSSDARDWRREKVARNDRPRETVIGVVAPFPVSRASVVAAKLRADGARKYNSPKDATTRKVFVSSDSYVAEFLVVASVRYDTPEVSLCGGIALGSMDRNWDANCPIRQNPMPRLVGLQRSK